MASSALSHPLPLIPMLKSVRIKNDRRDALTLARLYRAGELTGIYVPDPEDEAIRDRARARNDTRLAERKAKQRINNFLLRHNFVYPGKKPWTKTYFVWLGKVCLKHPKELIAYLGLVSSENSSGEKYQAGAHYENRHQSCPYNPGGKCLDL